MAAAARTPGHERLLLTDHSQSLKVAGGLTPAEVKKARKEIDALNDQYKGFRINAHYERLDLNDVHARMAADLGVTIVISTDAHNAAGLSMMRFGLAVARRAWIEPRQALNTRSLKDLLTWAGRGRVTTR